MKKSEELAYILDVVSQETEITPEEITGGSKKSEILDARFIFVYMLARRGFRYREIALYTNITRQSACRIVNYFCIREAKGGKIFELNLNAIRKRLENN